MARTLPPTLPPNPSPRQDEYFLHVELLSAEREVLGTFGLPGPRTDVPPTATAAGRSWAFGAEEAATCSSDCVVGRKDGTAFWKEVRHTFSDYGTGVRFVRWRDGGRDAGAYNAHGALLNAPSLTIDLSARSPTERACGSCSYHGGKLIGDQTLCTADTPTLRCAASMLCPTP